MSSSIPSELPQPSRRHWGVWAVLVIFVIYCAVFIYCTTIIVHGVRYFCLFDDAMISMRYAWNLAHGYGPVWNPGERVEGYSNPLTMLIMTAAILVGGKLMAPLIVQIFGIFVLCGIVLAVTQISDELIESRDAADRARTRLAVALCAAFYYHLLFFALTGMETGLVCLLSMLGALCGLRYAREPRARLVVASAMFLGLAYITRPDSLITAALVFGMIMMSRRGRANSVRWRRDLFGACAVFASFLITQHLFRYWYYHELWPNTYMLKATGMPIITRLRNGFAYTALYFAETSLALLLAIGYAWHRRTRIHITMLLIPLAMVAYTIYVGGDAWQYWRMAAPGFPILAVLLVGAARTLAIRFAKNDDRPPGGAMTVGIALVALLMANGHALLNLTLLRFPSSLMMINHLTLPESLAISEITEPDAKLGLFIAGTIPYMTERPAIDFLGKSDKLIARLPADISGAVNSGLVTSTSGHNKYNLDYSLKQLRPDLLVDKPIWGRQNLMAWARDHYVIGERDGVKMYLLKGSPHIRWDKLSGPAVQIPAEEHPQEWHR